MWFLRLEVFHSSICLSFLTHQPTKTHNKKKARQGYVVIMYVINIKPWVQSYHVDCRGGEGGSELVHVLRREIISRRAFKDFDLPSGRRCWFQNKPMAHIRYYYSPSARRQRFREKREEEAAWYWRPVCRVGSLLVVYCWGKGKGGPCCCGYFSCCIIVIFTNIQRSAYCNKGYIHAVEIHILRDSIRLESRKLWFDDGWSFLLAPTPSRLFQGRKPRNDLSIIITVRSLFEIERRAFFYSRAHDETKEWGSFSLSSSQPT